MSLGNRSPSTGIRGQRPNGHSIGGKVNRKQSGFVNFAEFVVSFVIDSALVKSNVICEVDRPKNCTFYY